MSNFSGQFHGMPYMAPYGAVPVSAPVQAPPGPLSKTNLKAALKRLVNVSQDMENTGKSLVSARNPVMRDQLQGKMDKLSKEQAELMKMIVDTAENDILKKEFLRLTRTIGNIQEQIKNCKTAQELETLQSKVDNVVSTWVNIFRDLTMDAIKCSKA